MKLKILLVLNFFALSLFSFELRAEDYCGFDMFTKASVAYNKLACDANTQLNAEKYSEAITSFEQALKIRIYDAPNFELLPLLALAYSKSEQQEKAESSLLKAKLSLLVFSGVLECNEGDKGFEIRNSSNSKVITDKESQQVVAMMCGAAYDHVYVRDSYERVLVEAELLSRYAEIESLVLKNK